jgi:Mg2+ and Co2+ transporter CorA
MVTTLINRDMIKFNKIYEVFDGLDVFTSKWENDIKNKLEDINQNLLEVIESIHQMSYKITNSLSSINTSIGDLSTSINKQLSSINSSVDLNTIITGINTYQLYKINKNTKSLN